MANITMGGNQEMTGFVSATSLAADGLEVIVCLVVASFDHCQLSVMMAHALVKL